MVALVFFRRTARRSRGTIWRGFENVSSAARDGIAKRAIARPQILRKRCARYIGALVGSSPTGGAYSAQARKVFRVAG